MTFISHDMARDVICTADDVIAELPAEDAGFVRALEAFALAQVDHPETVNAAAPMPVEDPKLVAQILRVIGGWPAQRWTQASAWQMVLSAYLIALGEIAPVDA